MHTFLNERGLNPQTLPLATPLMAVTETTAETDGSLTAVTVAETETATADQRITTVEVNETCALKPRTTPHRRSQGGAEGAIAPPKIPKKYVFNEKVAPNFYFSAQKPAREAYRLTAAIQGSGVPPKNSAPSKTNSWLRVCHTTHNRRRKVPGMTDDTARQAVRPGIRMGDSVKFLVVYVS